MRRLQVTMSVLYRPLRHAFDALFVMLSELRLNRVYMNTDFRTLVRARPAPLRRYFFNLVYKRGLGVCREPPYQLAKFVLCRCLW